MKQEAVQNTNDENVFVDRIETIKAGVRDHFSKFLSPEFVEANKDLGERNNILLEAFANYKDAIELDTEYVIDGDALVHLRTITSELIEGVTKGVDETNNYIALYDLVMDNDNTSIIFKQAQLQYVGEMFTKCSFNTIEEARKIKESQDALKPVYNDLFFNTKEIQMAAQMVQTIEKTWQLEGLPAEDAEQADETVTDADQVRD